MKFKEKITKINETIEKIDNQLGEVEVLQALIEQLMDNHADLKKISKRADENPAEERWLKYEFDRISRRTETFFNHSHEIIRKIDETSFKTLKSLTDIGNELDSNGLRSIEPITTYDKALFTQLCNMADKSGLATFQLDDYAKKYAQEKAHVKCALNKLEYNRLIDCNPSLDGAVYSIQIFNFSEDMREPLNQ